MKQGPRKLVATKILVAGVCLLVAGTGCAKHEDTATPAPPPLPPPTASPAPPLSPGIAHEETQKLRKDAEDRIAAAEQIVTRIDEKTLSKEQQETFFTIQDLLLKAREAFSVADYPRAFILADKANVLAEGLPATAR